MLNIELNTNCDITHWEEGGWKWARVARRVCVLGAVVGKCIKSQSLIFYSGKLTDNT